MNLEIKRLIENGAIICGRVINEIIIFYNNVNITF